MSQCFDNLFSWSLLKFSSKVTVSMSLAHELDVFRYLKIPLVLKPEEFIFLFKLVHNRTLENRGV